MSARTYIPKSVIVTAGNRTISGFAPDSLITLEPASVDFTRTLGVDGFNSRAKVENNAWTVTLFLQSTSPSNDVLTTFLQNDRNNNAVFRFDVTDLSGSTRFASSYAWIAERPTVTMASEVGTFEWVIHTDNSDYNIGNNFTPSIQNNT